jgi:hypothetical protein
MKYAKITYAFHARKRMKQRRISERQVIRTLEEPDMTYPSKGKLVAERRTTQGNTLRVVYIESPEGPQVVSAVVITAIRIGQ